MKKTLKQLTFITLALFAFSCANNKNEVEPASSASVKNGRMVFSDVSNYENIVTNSTSREKVFSNARIEKFTCLASNSADATVDASLYDSEFLQQVLNKDGIVQIGTWLIKVDMAKKKCFILDEKFSHEYQDLVSENTSNQHIQVYSTEENVLDLLANNQSSELLALNLASAKTTLLCRDRRANEKQTGGYTYINSERTVQLVSVVKYQSSGIYFSLQGKVKAYEYDPFAVYPETIWKNKSLRLRLDYDYRLNIRCGESRSGASSVYESDNELNYRAYEHIRALEHYFYTIRSSAGGFSVDTPQYNIND